MKKKINKKTYYIIVILQVILLVLLKNSITDLYYTGFQNKGFSNKVIDKITAKTYDKYASLMKLEDFDAFDKTYKYDKNKDIYTLKKKYDKEKIENITKEILPMHYLFYQGLQTSSKEVLEVTQYQNIYNVLAELNDKQKDKILKNARLALKQYSDKELKELIIKDIQIEYKNLGYNINDIKSKYITNKLIKISILTFILILISILNIKVSKKIISKRKIELIQEILLLIITFIYMFRVKILLTIILSVIYLFIIVCFRILDNLRRKINTYNIELSKLEDVIDTNKQKEKNYIAKWIIIPIILLFTNLILYNRYTTYHIFTGIDPYTFQKNLLYYYILVINIFVFRGFFFQILEIVKENRPAIRKEKKKIEHNEVNSQHSNSKKKKKKKKSKK